MHYVKALTVPANTSAETPASTTIILPASVLQNMQITFPGGCARLVHVQIYDGTVLLFPNGAATDFAENSKTVTVKDMIIWDAAKTLTLKGWSAGTAYPHVITFNFEVNTAEEMSMKDTGFY
jgi:hypothetical protein